MTQSTESNILKIRNESIKIKRWYNFDIEIQSCYFSWKIKDIYSKTTIFRSNEKETNPRQILQISIKFFFYSTSLLSKLWSLFCNEDARSRTPLKTRSFFFFFHPVAGGGRDMPRGDGNFPPVVQVTGFLILLLRCKWERADLWQKVGIWRRIELDAALAASPRQITRKKKGG